MSVRILLGDVREKLADLPDESVHCVVTSPPYFGLRDYGTASWEGGDPACDHLKPCRNGAVASSTLRGREGPYPGEKAVIMGKPFGQSCGKCGATRTDKQIGLEPTPAEFVAVMVEVFREVRRVLRKDGTLWLNLGDTYASSPAGNWGKDMPRPGEGGAYRQNKPKLDYGAMGIKAKDLLGIPWRVAFALQADGWYLRQDIIWSKPNPMPESVTDRCTKAHEYLFLLAKSGDPTIWRARDTGEWSNAPDLSERLPDPSEEDPDGTVARWRGHSYYYDAEAIKEPVNGNAHEGRKDGSVLPARNGIETGGAAPSMPRGLVDERNRRSVWTVATQPFKEAHFATFPPDLIEPCIKAGCPKGGTVLDPFGGAGTTGLVADRIQRDAILIELNPEYAEIARQRIKGDSSLFSEVV
jgi:DNA modification methylase